MWSGGLWRQCGQTVRVQFVWSVARICFFHRANRMHKEISNWLHKPSWVHSLRCACVFVISSVAIYKDFPQFLYTSENLYQCNMWNELNILLYTRFPLLTLFLSFSLPTKLLQVVRGRGSLQRMPGFQLCQQWGVISVHLQNRVLSQSAGQQGTSVHT